MPNVLQHYDILTRYGLKAIPLRESTKIPVCKGWTDWNPGQNRAIFEQNPRLNMGIILGDIVDVEGDSEQANKTILKLIGDCPHPSYTSAKSIHHLFLNPDPTLTILTHQKIEFRGHRHQSAVPPSTMPEDISYKWLDHTQFPIPPMPQALLQLYQKLRKVRPLIKPGHCKAKCHECQEESFIHRKRLHWELVAFKELGLRWSCHNCRTVDLRPMCRRLRKYGSGTTLVYDHRQ